MHFLLIVLSLFLAIGCSTTRKMTPAERTASASKEYRGLDREDLVAAARQVFIMMDRNDIKIETTEKGLIASRSWFMYKVVHASSGTDFWVFEVEEKSGKLVAHIKPTVRFGHVDSEEKGNLIQGTATYDLFWARLDFLLGRTKEWPTCEAAIKKTETARTWGSLEHICDSLTLNDEVPAGPVQNRSYASEAK